MTASTFRLLYNQDCTNLFGTTREPLTPAHVDRMVDEVADGGADVFLVNPNAQRVNYPSRVWQTFWDGYAPDRREFFGPVPEGDIGPRAHWVGQMQRLADQGCDYLARALAQCRVRGLTPGATIRMNDMHDVPWPGSHLFSRFYLDNPRLRLRNPPVCGWSAAGLNYDHPEVRDYFLALISEVAGYDIEMLELDFLRFHCYFPRGVSAARCETMTDFLRQVRRTLDATGRKIELVPRVAATPAAAGELGFDVAAWAREGLVDGVTAGAFLQVCWHTDIEEFRVLLGDQVPLYASTDYAACRPEGLPAPAFPLRADLMRGFAAGARAAGADGVCLFNFFCAREEKPRCEPLFAAIRDMKPECCSGVSKGYLLSAGGGLAETDGAPQLPAALPAGQPRAFWVWMAAETDAVAVEVEVVFESSDAVTADSLWLHVNQQSAGPAREMCEVAGAGKPLRSARFLAPAAALRDGRNTLVLRSEVHAVSLVFLEVRVGPGKR